jgi:hypothetical protein
MKSAFGIDHGISKSYLPGKGYVAANTLGRAGKKALGEHVAYSRVWRGNSGGSKFAEAAKYRKAKGRKLWEGFKTPMNRKVSVNTKPNLTSEDNPGLAGYARANGRGGGMVKVFPHAHASPEDVATTVRHETAHITPKRNIVRLHERTNEPIRSGREEGRADFIAHGRKSPGAYADDDPEFNRGYNQVQRKMHAAQQRKLKLT